MPQKNPNRKKERVEFVPLENNSNCLKTRMNEANHRVEEFVGERLHPC